MCCVCVCLARGSVRQPVALDAVYHPPRPPQVGLFQESWWLEELAARNLTAIYLRDFYPDNYEVRKRQLVLAYVCVCATTPTCLPPT